MRSTVLARESIIKLNITDYVIDLYLERGGWVACYVTMQNQVFNIQAFYSKTMI